VHNIAGELVSQQSGVGVSGAIRLSLQSASGSPVSTGIYLVQVRAVTLSGGLEYEKILKVAVVR